MLSCMLLIKMDSYNHLDCTGVSVVLANVDRSLLAFVDRLRVLSVNHRITINWCCRSQLHLAEQLAKFVRGITSDGPMVLPFVNSFLLVCNSDGLA